MNQEKVSGTQLTMLLFLIIMATLVLFVPAYTAREAKESAWLTPLALPLLVGTSVLLLAAKLERRFPGQSLLQYSKVIVGNIPGRIINWSYLLFFSFAQSLIVREIIDFINVTTLPRTPPWILILIAVLTGAYGAVQGLEVIVRSAQFVLPLFVLTFAIGVGITIPEFEPGRLLPILENGIVPVIRGSVTLSAWLGEVFIFLFLLPMLNKPREVVRKGALALVAISIMTMLDIAGTIMVMGADMTSRYLFPFWSMIRSGEYQDFIQRIESLLMVFWATSMIVKIAFVHYLISLILSFETGLKRNKAIIYTIPLQVVLPLVLFPSTPYLRKFITDYLPYPTLWFELILPLILFLIALMRRKRAGVEA